MEPPVFIVSVLVGGFAFGAIARFIVPRGELLTLAETTLVGIAGSAVGAILGNLLSSETALALRWGSVVGSIAGTVVLLVVVVATVHRLGLRLPQATAATAEALVADGEGHAVEFKQTARHNVHTGQRDPRLEVAVARTVAGFLNADGGTLLIGIGDDGTAVGLDDDLQLMKKPDLDRYELWLSDLLARCLGRPAVARVRVTFELVDNHTVCRVDVGEAPEPVFLDEPGGDRSADMYVRMGNSTRRLLTDEALDYSRTRWS